MLRSTNWPQVADKLADAIGQHEYSTWFSGSALLSSDSESITIGLPNAFVLAAAQRKHGAEVERVVAAAAGRQLQINYQTLAAGSTNGRTSHPTKPRAQPAPPILRAPYSMDGFVVGPENQLAHAAAQSIADGNNSFSPLFLHGPCGVGKTHLLRAIAAAAGRDRRSLYCTLEQFTNQLVSALRNNSPESLRKRYRSADIVLFDDVYFVAGKRATQEELFHTFDTVAANGGAVVLASDRSPAEMDELPARLRSRFAAGIVVDIQPPGFELRLAFVEHLVKRANVELPTGVRTALASSNIADFRKLTGIFNRLVAESRLRSESITTDQARRLLAHYDDAAHAPVNPDAVIAAVARLCQVEIKLLAGTSRSRSVIEARNLCAFALRQFTDQPLAAIGQYLGGRTHSTILNAIRRADVRISQDRKTRVLFEELEKQFAT
ncbi:MAG: chromosomal replication initiator protein DnaA [Chloroflexi bacterium]|nr:chromosomal replication initiator protein DnaA [Chloroflexota bacterium]MXY00785.1 chromosomal replication initiator protein DnaA [Chloroflexota bacterium]